MARSIYFPLLLAFAVFAYVQAVPVSETRPARGDIPDEELYPELYPERGDIPDSELYPTDDEESEAEIAKFKDDLKNAWNKVKSVVKEKYEEVINDPKIRESLKETANKLVDKTKKAVEKVLDNTRQKIDKITENNSAVPASEVAGLKDKAQEAWNDFKKLVTDKYNKIKDNPKVKEILDEAEKAVTKAKDTVNDIVDKVRKELEKIRE